MTQNREKDPLLRISKGLKRVAARTKKLVPVGVSITGVFPISDVKTSDYNITDDDYTVLANAASGAININMMSAADVHENGAGRVFTIKRLNSGANAVTVVADGSETIDGSGTYVLSTQYEVVRIQSDGSNWHTI